MSADNIRERKKNHRYTFVLVPDAKSEKTRTFSVTRWGFFSLIIASLIVLVALTVAVIVYTPIGAQLPVSDVEFSRKYGSQIAEIQKQLRMTVQELSVLRMYNVKLRKALGEEFSPRDTVSGFAGRTDTSWKSVQSLFTAGDSTSEQMLDGDGYIPAGSAQAEQEPGHSFEPRVSGLAQSLPMSCPVMGYNSRGYDAEAMHFGIDYAGKKGSPVTASADGIVIFADWTYDSGYMVMVSHELGFVTVYKHNQAVVKKIGDVVKRGEIIALLGDTGEKSTGPHLHFELWKNGIVQNPNNYLLSTN